MAEISMKPLMGAMMVLVMGAVVIPLLAREEVPPEDELPPVNPPGEEPPEIPPIDEPPQITPGQVVFSNLIVSPTKIYLGESVKISVQATNTGEAPIEFDLYLGDDTKISTNINLAAGETGKYSWTFWPTETGRYSVWAGELHNMFEVTTKVEEKETPPIFGTVLYTVSSWIVYSASDGRGTVYRYGLSWSVVEYWVEVDGVHRIQVKGTTPFGVWPEHHVFEVGSFYYDPYVAMFSYMDAGCPQGYKSEGWWLDQVNYCQYHPPGTPEWDEMNELSQYFCSFSPYARPAPVY